MTIETNVTTPPADSQCGLCWKHEGHFDWCVARAKPPTPRKPTNTLTRRTAILIRRLLASDYMQPVFDADPEFRDTLMKVRDRLFSIHNRQNQIGRNRG